MFDPTDAPEPSIESVRAALAEQGTEKVRRAALRYARQRAILVRRAGRRTDDLYPRELAQDALADTWMGTVAWDPARCPLLDHLRDVIRSRSWKDALSARRSPHFSLDADDTAAITSEASLQFAAQGATRPIMIAELTVRVVAELRRLSVGDIAATAILEAWADGYIEQEDVMARTGLTGREYRSARRRLTYLVRSLPRSLREATKTLLRSVS
jgi:hypothetical protein